MKPPDLGIAAEEYFNMGAEAMRASCLAAVMAAWNAKTVEDQRPGLWAASDIILAVAAPRLEDMVG